MKFGSLFDGSGTAPLAAAMCGIEPVWASEIEPFPIKVTSKRFPNMKHLGSILDINGAEVEPVDVICGGSPCQDLSVAGKQKGLHEGERSHLFFKMTRIIREMREATNGKYPRYVIWENVCGTFGSNYGNDFLAVLQAFAEIADPDVHVPRPPCKGKTDRLDWKYSGSIVGDGWSITYRTVDAQYWGVPQRRRRIYLVADFASERAGEILFEPKSVSGDSEPCGTSRQGTAEDAEGCSGGSGGTWSLSAKQQPLATGRECASTFDCRNHVLNEELSATLQAKEGGGFSLNYINPVVYDARGNGTGGVAPTLTGDHQRRVTDYTAICCRNTGADMQFPFDMQAFGKYGDGQTGSALKQRDYKDATDLVVDVRIYPGVGITSKQNASNPQPGDPSPTISTDSRNYLVSNTRPPRRYIVRRLTPLECCRLQGFPDWWIDGCSEERPVDIEFVRTGALDYIDPNGKIEGSDSAQYKLWGNGMALPNMLHVMRGIANQENEQ